MAEPSVTQTVKSSGGFSVITTTYRTPELAEFLLARIAEDEASARTEWPFNEGPHLSDCCLNAPDHMIEGTTKWCDCGYPARVLADIESKRRIVGLWEGNARHIAARSKVRLPSDALDRDNRVLYDVLIRLAAVYADHPDFRDEWAA